MDRIGKPEFDALSKMPFDLEIMGRLYYQAKELLLSQGFEFFKSKDEERDKFIAVLLNVMIKISAMQYHLKQYEQYEQLCIDQMKAQCQVDDHISLQAYELLFELEAFMFQMKSALDLAVKFLEALFPKRFKTKTFGDMGENLIKNLEKFKGDRNAKTEMVDAIIGLIRDDQKAWLKQAITLRTSLNHFKTIAGYNYQAKRESDQWQITVPRIAGVDVLKYMQIIYTNCLEFIQDFMCLVIGMFMPKQLIVGIRDASTPSIGAPLGQYIRFGWGFATNNVDSSEMVERKDPTCR